MSDQNELTAVFDTGKGKIRVKLFADKVPYTVANFVNLASRGFYDGLNFHRVIPDFMIQGGCPNGNGMGGPGYDFADEFDPELIHDRPGILSMANAGPNTNGSQFFITVVPTPWLNPQPGPNGQLRGHTIFGEVTEGYSVVDAISKVAVSQTRPIEPVVIKSVRVKRK